MNQPATVTQYRKMGLHTEVDSASPHKLIEMLLDGALVRMRIAKACLERGDVVGKCENLDWAIAIIGGLQSSLNRDEGGKIAANLDELYTFSSNRLALANARNDAGLIDEVVAVFDEIDAGWRAIGQQASAASAETVSAAV